LLAGKGVAIQPDFLMWRELQSGVLEHIMPDWAPPPLGLHLIMPVTPFRPLSVQAVIDHLAIVGEGTLELRRGR
jgi:DNA-binding transcriptional LysR family regulator